jgi:hypothetical protein
LLNQLEFNIKKIDQMKKGVKLNKGTYEQAFEHEAITKTSCANEFMTLLQNNVSEDVKYG